MKKATLCWLIPIMLTGCITQDYQQDLAVRRNDPVNSFILVSNHLLHKTVLWSNSECQPCFAQQGSNSNSGLNLRSYLRMQIALIMSELSPILETARQILSENKKARCSCTHNIYYCWFLYILFRHYTK